MHKGYFVLFSRYMFWTDHNKNSPHIGRAFMDGSSQRVLLSKDVVWPNGLAIDFKGKPNKINTGLNTNIV